MWLSGDSFHSTLYDSPKDFVMLAKDSADAFPSIYFCVVYVFSTTKTKE